MDLNFWLMKLPLRYRSSSWRPKVAPKKPAFRVSGTVASSFDVITAFGGPRNLARALKKVGLPKDAACIYRWSYPYPRGTGGRVPAHAYVDVLVAANWAKVDLSRVKRMPRKKWGK